MPMEAATTSERVEEATKRPAVVRIRTSDWRGWCVKGEPLHEWLERGGRPESIPVSQESIVRDGSRSRCARITRLDDLTPLRAPLFFKAYRRRPGAQAWIKRMIGWHLPSWVWRTSWRLLDAGVPVARPQGYLAPRGLLSDRTAFFWSEWIEGAVSAKALARNPSTCACVAGNMRFAEQSAELLARLHDAGAYHRDMNWGNLLVTRSMDKVWLIDLDSAHHWPLSARFAALRDLARFLMDAEEYEAPPEWRQRFLDVYAQVRGLSVHDLSPQVQAMMREFYDRRRKKHVRRARRRERDVRRGTRVSKE